MGIFHVFHIEIFRLNFEFLGNPIASQKQLLEYKNVHMTFVCLRTTHSKFEAQELGGFFCMGIRMGENPKNQAGNERSFKLYYPCG